MATESLRADKSLLDSNFEGYKLSSDQPDAKSANLVSGVNVVSLREDLFSLQHVRAFGRPNHLVRDPWQNTEQTERVYWVDRNYEVQQATIKGLEVESIESVFKIPAPENKAESLNATVYFPSSTFACVGDGYGKLYVVSTDGRTEGSNAEWKALTVNQFDQPFVILHALQDKDSNNLSCLLLSIIENDEVVSAKKAHIVILTLAMFSQVNTTGSCSFTCEAVKRYQGHCAPVYGAVEPGSKAILVASEKPFHLLKENGDSKAEEKVPGSDAKNDDDDDEKSPDIAYTWSQGIGDATITFELPEDTKREDIVCDIKPGEININVGSKCLLRGALYAKVKSDESTWTLEKNCLEVALEKQVSEHHWSTVVVGDTRGKYILVGEEVERVKEIHSQLEQYSSDKLNPDPNKANMPYNAQQFEECDQFPEDTEYIMRMDINTGEITHKVCLASHQWLFNTSLSPNIPPVFCLRHDVDGLVWQPKTCADSEESKWNHIATFNALGFVQASKENCRFSTCAPGLGYAVMCDHTRHVYIYHRNAPGSKVAVQQVVAVNDSEDSILGLQASDHRILVLTPNSLNVINVQKS